MFSVYAAPDEEKKTIFYPISISWSVKIFTSCPVLCAHLQKMKLSQKPFAKYKRTVLDYTDEIIRYWNNWSHKSSFNRQAGTTCSVISKSHLSLKYCTAIWNKPFPLTEILCLVLLFLFEFCNITRGNMRDEIIAVCLRAFPGIIM